MLFCYVVYIVACVFILAAGIVEQRRHHANLRAIPARVLVNGTRGKSSITRLCAGALRGGDLVTVAKTTGTAARFVHPDAHEDPVYRKFGIANVIEQIGVVRRAVAYSPDVLVVECMAVMPELQEINQTKLISSTIGVISNVRLDHVEEMGPTIDDIACSLSRSMPEGGICVTAERERLSVLEQEAARRCCELVVIDPETVTDEEMEGFGWITFKENVAIALAVAELLGVDRGAALRGMWSSPPDPGALTVDRFRVKGKQLRFANLLAVNDPESTLMNIEELISEKLITRPLHVVIGCRPDRIERNRQIAALIPQLAPERVVLIGEPTRSARTAVPGPWHGRVCDLGGRRSAVELLDGVIDGIEGEASVVAIGSIHGQGERLLGELQALERIPADAVVWTPERGREGS